jgi:hypothetical protein
MPWHQEPKKGAVSCEKPRVVANRRRTGDSRMGKPATGNAVACSAEKIGWAGELRELKHLSTWRKRKYPRFPK